MMNPSIHNDNDELNDDEAHVVEIMMKLIKCNNNHEPNVLIIMMMTLMMMTLMIVIMMIMMNNEPAWLWPC